MNRNPYEERSKRTYDKKAQQYEATFEGKFTVRVREMLYNAVSINPNDTVLDVACGDGRLLEAFTQKASFRGYGVDISGKMVEQAEKRNPGMRFFTAGCENLPFQSGDVDVMTVCAAYHHFPNVEDFAQEASRVIKSGGRLYIAEIYLPALLRTVCNPFLRFSRTGDVKFYSPNEIARLFEEHQFLVKEVTVKHRVQLIQLQRK